MGGTDDEIHILTGLPAMVSVANLMRDLKRATSPLANRREPTSGFRWQGGYGAFTVARSDVDAVAAYVRDQPAHHAKGSVIVEWERCRDVL